MNPIVAEFLRRVQNDPTLAAALRRAPAQTLDRVRGLSPRDRAFLIDAARANALPSLVSARPDRPRALAVRSNMMQQALEARKAPPPIVMKNPHGGVSSYDLGLVLATPESQPRAASMKLWQLIGGDWKSPFNNEKDTQTLDMDRHYDLPVRSRTATWANVAGTDLGVPVVGTKDGIDVVFFFFGDTILDDEGRTPADNNAPDCYGFTEKTQNVFQVPPWIRFFLDQNGDGFLPIRIDTTKVQPPGNLPLEYGGFDVPVGGFSVGGSLFLIYNSNVDASKYPVMMQRTVIARSQNQGGHFDYHGDIANSPNDRLFGASAVVARASDWDIPTSGDVVLFFGTDPRYQKSEVYLAFCPVSDLMQPTSGKFPGLRYLEYIDYSNGVPGTAQWSMDPLKAMPLFTGGQHRELSVIFEPVSGLWLMAHAPGYWDPGLILRWAPTPIGPWGTTVMKRPNSNVVDAFFMSDEPKAVLYDEWRDHGPGNN